MSIESDNDLRGLLRIGRIVGLTLREMRERLRLGMTTAELDAIGRAFLERHGARSAPMLAYDFPGATCISINDEAAHGIPGDRLIRPGDLVNIDVSAELDGYFADAAVTVPVPPTSDLQRRLCGCAQVALEKSIAVARAGRPINAIGRQAEAHARRCGFRIIRELTGHGVGRHIHEPPTVPNYDDRKATALLSDGLVITVEPFLSAGSGRVIVAEDGWTLKSPDGSLTVQYEHTIVVSRGRPLVITAA